MTNSGVSLTFSAEGVLVFTGGQNSLRLTSLNQDKPSSRLSNLVGKTILTTSQFASKIAPSLTFMFESFTGKQVWQVLSDILGLYAKTLSVCLSLINPRQLFHICILTNIYYLRYTKHSRKSVGIHSICMILEYMWRYKQAFKTW